MVQRRSHNTMQVTLAVEVLALPPNQETRDNIAAACEKAILDYYLEVTGEHFTVQVAVVGEGVDSIMADLTSQVEACNNEIAECRKEIESCRVEVAAAQSLLTYPRDDK